MNKLKQLWHWFAGHEFSDDYEWGKEPKPDPLVCSCGKEIPNKYGWSDYNLGVFQNHIAPILKAIGAIALVAPCVYLVVYLALAVCMVPINYGLFSSDMAEIEQLRADVEGISESQSEDAIGLAIKKNVEIASTQRQNKMWSIGWMIPDGWDDVKMIEIPKEAQRAPTTKWPEGEEDG